MTQLKKIVITGATGFIGSALCKRLAGHYQIVVVTRDTEQAKIKFGDDFNYVSWDDIEELIRSVSGAWGIINLAGENIGSKSWTIKQKQIIIDSRLNAGKKLLHAIHVSGQKPVKFIQMSAIGYYTHSVFEEYNESSISSNNSFLHNVVKQWETSSSGVSKYGVDHIIVRCGIVFDKKEGILKKMVLPFRLFIGGTVGSGEQWISWIHLNDLLEAITFLLENENSKGIYNLTSPNPLTNEQFGKIVAKKLNRPYRIKTPSFLLKLLFGRMADETILASQKVIPQRLLNMGFNFKYKSINSVLET